MIRYRIPDNFLSAFQVLAGLSPDETDELAEVISGFPVGGTAKNLQEALMNKEFIHDPVLVANVLFSFGELLLNEDMGVELLAKDLSNAYQKQRDPGMAQAEREGLEKNLLKLFSNSAKLVQTFKAFQLLTENGNTYNRARILTDIRPIFNAEGDASPVEGLIIHQLKLKYSSNNEDKEIFISLDLNDLMDLEKQLVRAKKKEAKLKETFQDLHFIQLKD